MNILKKFENHFLSYLSLTQFQTLSILVGLINEKRTCQIEKLATCFSLPILFESRRKHVQRFLALSCLSISLIWLPIIKVIIETKFSVSSDLIMAWDRTQWYERNILMVSLIYKGHALPLYWNILEKKGTSNLKEQKAVLRPVLNCFKKYKIVLIGDREFHSIELATWLKREKRKRKGKLEFALRQKQGTFYHKGGKKYEKLSQIEIKKGIKQMKMGIKTTKKKGFSRNNLAIYQKRKSQGKSQEEPWYILTSLSDVELVISIYEKRMGIETMFKDYKKGGYNLEGSKANTKRLTSILLLVAIAYTSRSLSGEKIRKHLQQKYLGRIKVKKQKNQRNSNFWLGLYGTAWIDIENNYEQEVKKIRELNLNKRKFYLRGIKAKEKIRSLYYS